MNYPKRLIEVDLPIARISAHARREKSIRHGHISTLHIWWARRPLAACRAVICASLWPDPVDLNEWLDHIDTKGEVRAPRGESLKPGEGVAIRPKRFLDESRRLMRKWATQHAVKSSVDSMDRITAIQKDASLLEYPEELRGALLDFIADFANWDNSTDADFLSTARALTQAAHETLGGEPGTRPLVVDPFAGGGSIPLEALRVGADAFASDLNPIPVLLNKVVLEYIPKYGNAEVTMLDADGQPRTFHGLADAVRYWGGWIKEQAERELAAFYPPDPPDKKNNIPAATPIAYLWARTIISEAPTQYADKHGNPVFPPDDDCEPFDGIPEPPVEVPLMRSLWLAKKAGRRRALRWVRDEKTGKVKTQTVEVTYQQRDDNGGPGSQPASGGTGLRPVMMKVKRPLLEIFEPKKDSEVEGGTVARGSATCPVTGYTTPVTSVRAQLKQRRGGAADARLFCIVTTRAEEQGRFYRLPTKADEAAFAAAGEELRRRMREEEPQRHGGTGKTGSRQSAGLNGLSMVPDEPTPLGGGRGAGRAFSQRNYGMDLFSDIFSPRQLLALTTLARLVRKAGARMAGRGAKSAGHAGETAAPKPRSAARHPSFVAPQPISSAPQGRGAAPAGRSGAPQGRSEAAHGRGAEFHERESAAHGPNAADVDWPEAQNVPNEAADAVQTCLAITLARLTDRCSSLGRYDPSAKMSGINNTFSRQALSMVWDFGEGPPISDRSGGWGLCNDWVLSVIEANSGWIDATSHVQLSDATRHPLPDDAAIAFVTDPPYYDSVPYSDLSDYFYVWLKRSLPSALLPTFTDTLTPKDAECIVDDAKGKDHAFFEASMMQAMTEGRRVTRPDGVGVVVFAHKSTGGWEAQLRAMIDAGWIVTGSWPIDTEMGNRLRAMDSAALASSVHIVMRPREDAGGAVRTDDVGDWRDVLAELPRRMHAWMPRLAAEGVVGADAIFACLGPALEIFSRYSRVEKASGEVVTLGEYLEQVWAAVSNEALSVIFKDADAGGLEPDARLTAMWLWTIGAGKLQKPNGAGTNGEAGDETERGDDEDEEGGQKPKVSGFVLEFDAARKIAQGLGVHLEKSASIIEIRGETARLLSVSERARYLFGKDAASEASGRPRKRKDAQAKFDFAAELDALEAEAATTGGRFGAIGGDGLKPGATVLDKVHQAMILFAAGRGEAVKRFLVEEGVGKDGRFWKLAQALSALYPPGTDERRWIEGVQARKRGLGF